MVSPPPPDGTKALSVSPSDTLQRRTEVRKAHTGDLGGSRHSSGSAPNSVAHERGTAQDDMDLIIIKQKSWRSRGPRSSAFRVCVLLWEGHFLWEIGEVTSAPSRWS